MRTLTRWMGLVFLPVLLLLALPPAAHAHAAGVHHLSVLSLGIGATLAANLPTLADLASRLDPNGNVANIVEILNEFNEINDDMVVIEANSKTGHKTTIRTGIPLPTFRKLYGGVQPGKSTTISVTDSFGMMENYSKVDKALADLSTNPAAFRLSEDRPIIEGFAQTVAQNIFYGNEKTTPEKFTGLAPRFSSKTAENGINQIIDGGGTGATNTSIWLIVWGDQTCHGIFPQGSKVGITQTDKGVTTIQNADGSMYEAYLTHFRWDFGLCVRDWRYIVRIANVDVTQLPARGGALANAKNIVQWMTQATERIPSFAQGRAAFYCNRPIRENLRLGIIEKQITQLTWDTVAGKRVLAFDGIPVRRCDQILSTEAQVT